MNPARLGRACVVAGCLGVALGIAFTAVAGGNAPNLYGYIDPTGIFRTYNVSGAIDFSGPFFQSLGTNGRSCASCHQPADGWTITPAHVQARFESSDGEDPIFRTNDGSNSPVADVSSEEARRSAYSMLLTKGLVRVGIGMPPDAEFDLIDVDDPYGYASAAELSLFRRPLPSTNLLFLATVMWAPSCGGSRRAIRIFTTAWPRRWPMSSSSTIAASTSASAARTSPISPRS